MFAAAFLLGCIALVGVMAGIQAIQNRWFPKSSLLKAAPSLHNRKRDTAIGVALSAGVYLGMAWWGGPRVVRRLLGIAALFVIVFAYAYVNMATINQLKRDKLKAAGLIFAVGLLIAGWFIFYELINELVNRID